MDEDLYISIKKLLTNTEYKEDINHFIEDIHNINNLIEKGLCFLSPRKIKENQMNLPLNFDNSTSESEIKNKKLERKNYTIYSYQFKLKILDELKLHPLRVISKKYNIPYPTIIKWKKHGIDGRTKKKIRKIGFRRSKNISEETIKKALLLYKKYPPNTMTRNDFRKKLLKITNEKYFVASYSWVTKFEKKYNLQFLSGIKKI